MRFLTGLTAAEALSADLTPSTADSTLGTIAVLALAAWLGDRLARTAVRLDHAR